MLKRVVLPESPCLTLDDAKLHLRVDNDAEDREIEQQLAAAIDLVEDQTGLALAPATYEVTFDSWPGSWPTWADPAVYPQPTNYLELPVTPVRAITWLKYMDADGAQQTVDAANYYWRPTSEGAQLYLVSGYSTPTLWGRPADIAVRFTAGFNAPGQAADDPALTCPPRARTAVLQLLGDWYANREHSVIGSSVNELPTGLKLTLNSLRVFR